MSVRKSMTSSVKSLGRSRLIMCPTSATVTMPRGGNFGCEPGGGREYLLDVELADHDQRRDGDPRQLQVRWLPFGSRLGVGGKVVRERLASHFRQPLAQS